jgi:hypothetical protein
LTLIFSLLLSKEKIEKNDLSCYYMDSEIKFSGGNAEGATPVPIPNTEVKTFRADDTMIARLWESRSLPD